MIYTKLMKICFGIAIVVLLMSNVVFAVTDLGVNDDKVYNGVMQVLFKLQKYSWPVAIIILIYALYQYYVIGSEAFEHKVAGQGLIMGLSIFMAILQSLPLLYAILIVK
ncbi:MAG: hypothetical protein PHR25_04490 [Clostridia bacterium]|nr:hypothetical protein [Clostridia bacterium]MDD4376022.1 hypothetical protein [Clostridia bacterium]